VPALQGFLYSEFIESDSLYVCKEFMTLQVYLFSTCVRTEIPGVSLLFNDIEMEDIKQQKFGVLIENQFLKEAE
jgi:hypothetical protein